MYTKAQLILLARAFIAATRMRPSTLGTLAAGNDRLFSRLLTGGDCRLAAAERASDWFDRNWPVTLPWPVAVPRRPGGPVRWRPAPPAEGEIEVPSEAPLPPLG